MKQISEESRNEVILGVEYGKAYFITDRRNRWINWNGDTMISLMPRAFVLTLKEAEEEAESMRVQGSGFIIDEVPVVCARGRISSLIFCERRRCTLMNRWVDPVSKLSGNLTIAKILEVVDKTPGYITRALLGHPRMPLTETDGVYYERQSSPGHRGNGLGWVLKPQDINDDAVKDIAKRLRLLVEE